MKKIIATAFFNEKKIKGTIHFYENLENNNVLIDIDLSGFRKNNIHAIHIHEAGDLTDSCMGACAHFNPFGKNHGGINSKERHVGDLGNIESDKDGNVKIQIIDNMIKLRGIKSNIIGRSVVIHEDEDDNGLGGYEDSLITGHAGKRMCCAVIGYSKKMFHK
jgi:Cu-Zn family superoxide dismutase